MTDKNCNNFDYYNNFCKSEFEQINKKQDEILAVLKGNGKIGLTTEIALLKKDKEEKKEQETKREKRIYFVITLIVSIISIAVKIIGG